jgi:hypothetical protein
MSIATVNIVVPTTGDGPIASIANLVRAKTMVLSGFFRGSYTLLASHDDVTFVPVLLFDANGIESIEQTLPDAYSSVKLRSNAATPLTPMTAEISGISVPGDNHFAVLATFLPGGGGTGAVVNTALLFPPTGLEEDINFICEGGLSGTISVDGSLDGTHFNNVGIFTCVNTPRPLVGLPPLFEFAPLSTPDKIRYLKISVRGQISSQVVLTIGGRIPTATAAVQKLITAISEDEGRVALSVGTDDSEVILYEDEVNLTDLPIGASITFQMNSIIQALEPGVTATFRVYAGSTTPGNTTGGTVRAFTTTSSNVEVGDSVIGASFANPGGKCQVQITGQVPAPGIGNPANQAIIRGVTVVFG